MEKENKADFIRVKGIARQYLRKLAYENETTKTEIIRQLLIKAMREEDKNGKKSLT